MRRFTRATYIELGIIVAALAYFTLSPALVDIPLCPQAWLTGKPCPTCGTTRSVWNLLHGNLSAAWALNPIGYLVVLVLLRRVIVLLFPQSRLVRIIDCHKVNLLLLATYLTIGSIHVLVG